MKLILLLILSSTLCFGADFYYKYDASGNRELRSTTNPYKISVEADFDSDASNDSLLSNSVNIYPNPTDGKIKIEVGKDI